MLAAEVSSLTAWVNFYVIVGSSAGALTGLMFVMITLIAGRPGPSRGTGIAAYGTPNVVHFCAALAVAAGLSAPWPSLGATSIMLGICGLGGVAYVLVVLQRLRRPEGNPEGYRPVLEDWLSHVLLPLIAYGSLLASALMLQDDPQPALFVVGAALLLLLFIGIHNAWDTITYIVAGEQESHLDEPD